MLISQCTLEKKYIDFKQLYFPTEGIEITDICVKMLRSQYQNYRQLRNLLKYRNKVTELNSELNFNTLQLVYKGQEVKMPSSSNL